MLNSKCDKINPKANIKSFTLVIDEFLKEILKYSNIDYVIRIPFVSLKGKLKFNKAKIMSEESFLTKKLNKTLSEKHQAENNIEDVMVQLNDKIEVEFGEDNENENDDNESKFGKSNKDNLKNKNEEIVDKAKSMPPALKEKKKYGIESSSDQKLIENEKSKEPEQEKVELSNQEKNSITQLIGHNTSPPKDVESTKNKLKRVMSKVEKDKVLIYLDKYEYVLNTLNP